MISLVLGVIGIALGSIPLGKFLGYSWSMAFFHRYNCIIWFPGTFIISQEVANAEGKRQKKKNNIY